jgi:cell wall-associated NlpC family hydrolase
MFLSTALIGNSTHHPSIPLILHNNIKITINIEWIDDKPKKSKYENKSKEEKLINIGKDIFAKVLFPKKIFTDFSKKRNIDNSIIKEAKEHLGKRYVWGAIGPKRFDCSGFTSYVYRKMGIKIPRVSKNQGKVGLKVKWKNLRKGDLVFFDTSRRRRGYINHVGIYIGNHKFIHASSSRRQVIISRLDKKFYKARFKWGRRVK